MSVARNHTPKGRPTKRQKLADTPATVASNFSDEESFAEEEDDTPLKLLPDDILGSIFFGGFVDSLEVVKINSVASRRMQDVAKATVTMLDLRRTMIETENLASIVARFPNLTDLDLSYCDKLESVSDLKGLKLRFLSLRGTAVDDAGFEDFLKSKNASLLEDLDLSASKADQAGLITNRTAKMVSKHCPNLKSLKLGWRRGITDAALPSMLKLKYLAVLDMSITAVTAEGCATLSAFRSLKKLDLSACAIGQTGLAKLLPKRKKSILTHLELRHNRTLDEQSLKLLVTQTPQLELLNVENSGLTRNDHKTVFLPLQRRGVLLKVEWEDEGVIDDL